MDPIDKQELYHLVNSLSKQYFYKPFKHEVVFNHRLRTTGGRYLPSVNRIELNPKYVTEMDESEFIGIIKRELCHYHLHIEGEGYKHGDEDFKKLLKETGPPRFCKPLPSTNSVIHLYKCAQCEQVYKRQRRVNVQRYRCGICKGQLIYNNEGFIN